jgi:hypothetical protein
LWGDTLLEFLLNEENFMKINPILTTDCAINEVEKEEKSMPNPGMGMDM